MYRLRRLDWPPKKDPPQDIARLTHEVVYERLAPGVLEELWHRSPSSYTGQRKSKRRESFRRDIGHPKLLEYLSATVALMRVSDSWEAFLVFLDKALPKWKDFPLVDHRDADRR
jgi:hypothetical protein